VTGGGGEWGANAHLAILKRGYDLTIG
jgi:hypothetical protein